MASLHVQLHTTNKELVLQNGEVFIYMALHSNIFQFSFSISLVLSIQTSDIRIAYV